MLCEGGAVTHHRAGEAEPGFGLCCEALCQRHHVVTGIEPLQAGGQERGIARPIMIDCSHDNSRKDHRCQGTVAREVLCQFRVGRQSIMELLLDSNPDPGTQTWKEGVPLAYGVSIIDACLGWEQTKPLLEELAESLTIIIIKLQSRIPK